MQGAHEARTRLDEVWILGALREDLQGDVVAPHLVGQACQVGCSRHNAQGARERWRCERRDGQDADPGEAQDANESRLVHDESP